MIGHAHLGSEHLWRYYHSALLWVIAAVIFDISQGSVWCTILDDITEYTAYHRRWLSLVVAIYPFSADNVYCAVSCCYWVQSVSWFNLQLCDTHSAGQYAAPLMVAASCCYWVQSISWFSLHFGGTRSASQYAAPLMVAAVVAIRTRARPALLCSVLLHAYQAQQHTYR